MKKLFIILFIMAIVTMGITTGCDSALSSLDDKISKLEKSHAKIKKERTQTRSEIEKAKKDILKAKEDLDAGKINKEVYAEHITSANDRLATAMLKLEGLDVKIEKLRGTQTRITDSAIQQKDDLTYSVKMKPGVFVVPYELFRGYANAKGRGMVSELIIGSDVMEIKSYAFANNQIDNLLIPAKVKYIGRSAFANVQASQLMFEFQSQLIDIGAGAFSENFLDEVMLPVGLQFIGNRAFAKNNLLEFTVPKSVVTIGGNIDILPEILAGNPVNKVVMTKDLYISLMTMYVEKHPKVTMNKILGLSDDASVEYKTHEGDTIVLVTTEMYKGQKVAIDHADAEIIQLANGMYRIVARPDLDEFKSFAFTGYMAEGDVGKVAELQLNDVHEKITHASFLNNRIEELTVPESVTEIGRVAFERNNMKILNIEGNNLLVVREGAFNSNLLEEIIFPKSVKELRGSSFTNNPNLKKVVMTRELFEWVRDSKYAQPNTPKEYLRGLAGVFGLGKVYNRELSPDLEFKTYDGETLLKGKDYTSVLHDDGMVSVNYHSGVKEIPNWKFPGTFEWDADTKKIVKIKAVSLNEELEVIGSHSFMNHRIPSLTIPASVHTIKRNAFEGNKMSILNIEGNNLLVVKEGAFNNNLLEEIILPKSVKELRGSSLSNNPNLKKVVMTRELFEWIRDSKYERPNTPKEYLRGLAGVFGLGKGQGNEYNRKLSPDLKFETHDGETLYKTRAQWLTHTKNALSWANSKDPIYKDISDKMKKVVISEAIKGHESSDGTIVFIPKTADERKLFEDVLKWLKGDSIMDTIDTSNM